MTRKMMKILAVMMACMMVLLVSAVSFAEDASVDIFAMEAPVKEASAQKTEAPVVELAPAGETASDEEPVEEPAPAEESDEDPVEAPVPAEEPASIDEPTPAEEPAAYDDDDLVEIDDDWGYVTRELIEQHTPEMTQEFIHADDPDWVPEGQEKVADEETAQENAVEAADEVTETEEKVSSEATEKTEETEITEATENEKSAETSKETEEAAEKNEGTEESAEGTEGTEEAEEPDEEAAEGTEESAEGTEGTEETEETEEPAEETEENVSKVVVNVTASMRNENLMHLKAHIEDPEERDYNYQWQVSVDGGENYEDVEDAEEDFFDVELDEENVSNLWRVKVHAI